MLFEWCHPECLNGVIQNVWMVSSRMFEGCHPECLNGVIHRLYSSWVLFLRIWEKGWIVLFGTYYHPKVVWWHVLKNVPEECSRRMFPAVLIGIPRKREIGGVLSSGLYKYFNYVAKKGFFKGSRFLSWMSFLKGFIQNVLVEVVNQSYIVYGFHFVEYERRVWKRGFQPCHVSFYSYSNRDSVFIISVKGLNQGFTMGFHIGFPFKGGIKRGKRSGTLVPFPIGQKPDCPEWSFRNISAALSCSP